jgi:hypothetical protein
MRFEDSRSRIGMGKGDLNETDQEEISSSECGAICANILNLFIGPSQALVKGISCSSSLGSGCEDFDCIRLWKD